MKRLISFIWHFFVFLLLVSIALVIVVVLKSKNDSTSQEIYYDPLKFKGVTVSELKQMLGEPDAVKKWNYEIVQDDNGKITYCPMQTYVYGEQEYIYALEEEKPKTLVRIVLKGKIPYKTDHILALFGLSDEYTNTQIAENGTYSYRVYDVGSKDQGIYDVWIPQKDENYLYTVNFTFYRGLFTDDKKE